MLELDVAVLLSTDEHEFLRDFDRRAAFSRDKLDAHGSSSGLCSQYRRSVRFSKWKLIAILKKTRHVFETCGPNRYTIFTITL